MNIPEHLRKSYDMIMRAFPDGMDEIFGREIVDVIYKDNDFFRLELICLQGVSR